jgi:hypothetical protein
MTADVLMIVLLLAAFALAGLYVGACDHLSGS